MRLAAAVVVAAVAGAGGAAVAAAGAALVAPPPPGPKGLEGVPIPKAPVLAEPQRLHLGESIDGIECERVEKVAFHTHAHLAIFVNGKQRQVPYGIGIGPPLLGTSGPAGPFVSEGGCFAWLHTHTADGIIHMEAPAKRSFTLGEFFDIWGQPLSTRRVGPARGKVTVLVDGKVRSGNPRAVPLRNHELIQLDVGAPQVAEQVVGFAKL